MPRRDELPPEFRVKAFDVRGAVAAGVTPDRLRSNDLQRPFHGVRSVGFDLTSVPARCAAYAVRMPDTAAFSHVTAAALWGFPLPAWVSLDDLHVSVSPGTRARRGKGVVGHQANLHGRVVNERGVRLFNPPFTWCQLAEFLAVPDLVAAAEFAVTGNPYERLLPVTTVQALVAASTAMAGARGQRNRDAALAAVREGALSRPESLLRFVLVASGIPEPRINENCNDARGVFIALADLSWPQFRVAVEYEGDHHRGIRQFRSDIHRFEKLADHGWVAIRVSADDLFDRTGEMVTRIAARLSARGWPSTVLASPPDLRR